VFLCLEIIFVVSFLSDTGVSKSDSNVFNLFEDIFLGDEFFLSKIDIILGLLIFLIF
jgi:hypothetical protein